MGIVNRNIFVKEKKMKVRNWCRDQLELAKWILNDISIFNLK